MSIITSALPGTTRDPLYPDSDGKPMGETGFHVLAMIYVWQALRDFFAGRDDIYVATDMFYASRQTGRLDFLSRL
jgi:hypothetical protein